MPTARTHSAQVDATGADNKRGRAAANMYWELGSDEALIVEFDAHDGLWMFTNMGAFFNSMDYLYRPVSYTPSRTKADSDGRIRLVIAHRDPGVYNWLDTQGFDRGNLTYRHMLEGEPAVLNTRLVKSDDLLRALPRGHHHGERGRAQRRDVGAVPRHSPPLRSLGVSLPRIKLKLVTEISEDELAGLSEFSLLSENAEQAGVAGPLPDVKRVDVRHAERQSQRAALGSDAAGRLSARRRPECTHLGHRHRRPG